MLSNDFDIAAAVEKMGLTPTSKANGVLRFGSRGSLSVNTSKNTFYDFESEEGEGFSISSFTKALHMISVAQLCGRNKME